MSRTLSGPGSERSDAELLAAWLDDDHEDNGETYLAIYTRFRDAVREAMVRCGLPPREAEQRVGSVFHRTRDTLFPTDTPLPDRLLAVARGVADDPDWTQPL